MKSITIPFFLLVSVLAFSQRANVKLIAPIAIENRIVTVFTSADSSSFRLSNTASLQFSDLRQPLETQTCIFVNPRKTFQTFLGIGGAITDASAEVFAQLPNDKKMEFLADYFSKEKGIGYSLIRTNIHSCDFSSASYTYVAEGDKDLTTFSIDMIDCTKSH